MTNDRNITVAPGGPYLVRGPVPVTTKSPVMSEHGEPLTWKTGDAAEGDSMVAGSAAASKSPKPTAPPSKYETGSRSAAADSQPPSRSATDRTRKPGSPDSGANNNDSAMRPPQNGKEAS